MQLKTQEKKIEGNIQVNFVECFIDENQSYTRYQSQYGDKGVLFYTQH